MIKNKDIEGFIYDDEGNEPSFMVSEFFKQESKELFESVSIQKEVVVQVLSGLFDEKRVINMYNMIVDKGEKMLNKKFNINLNAELLFVLKSLALSAGVTGAKLPIIIMNRRQAESSSGWETTLNG